MDCQEQLQGRFDLFEGSFVWNPGHNIQCRIFQSIPLVKDTQIIRHHTVQFKCQMFWTLEHLWLSPCRGWFAPMEFVVRITRLWLHRGNSTFFPVPAVSLCVSEAINQKGNVFWDGSRAWNHMGCLVGLWREHFLMMNTSLGQSKYNYRFLQIRVHKEPSLIFSRTIMFLHSCWTMVCAGRDLWRSSSQTLLSWAGPPSIDWNGFHKEIVAVPSLGCSRPGSKQSGLVELWTWELGLDDL